SFALTRRPPAVHYRQARASGRSARRRGGILDAKAPVAHQQSLTATGSKSEFVRSLHTGTWITVSVAKSNPYACGHPEAQNFVEIPRGTQETQISVAFLVGRSLAPWP